MLARTTADIALGLRVINGAMPLGDPSTLDIASLRVAVVATDGIVEPTDAARRAVTDAAAHLSAAGAQVSTWALPDPGEGLRLAFGVLGFDRLAHFREIAEGGKLDPRVKQITQLSNMPRPARRLMARTLDTVGQHGLAAGLRLLDTSPGRLANVVAELDRYRQRFAGALSADGIDAIVLPACPLPAVPHGATKQLATIGSYTILWNALGYPAGAVPFTTVRSDETGGRPKRPTRWSPPPANPNWVAPDCRSASRSWPHTAKTIGSAGQRGPIARLTHWSLGPACRRRAQQTAVCAFGVDAWATVRADRSALGEVIARAGSGRTRCSQRPAVGSSSRRRRRWWRWPGSSDTAIAAAMSGAWSHLQAQGRPDAVTAPGLPRPRSAPSADARTGYSSGTVAPTACWPDALPSCSPVPTATSLSSWSRCATPSPRPTRRSQR